MSGNAGMLVCQLSQALPPFPAVSQSPLELEKIMVVSHDHAPLADGLGLRTNSVSHGRDPEDPSFVSYPPPSANHLIDPDMHVASGKDFLSRNEAMDGNIGAPL